MSALPPTDPAPADLIAARAALSMHARDGLLLEGVPLAHIARALGTPTWVMAAQTIRARYRTLAAALPNAHIHYAVKANDHLAILALLAREGAGMDVVSAGELQRAQAAGIPPAKIVFSGVGKSTAEIGLALAQGIAQINVESAEELHQIAAIAAAQNRIATILLRVNPDVDAGTHAKISTGRAGDKFGIPAAAIPELYAAAAAMPHLDPVGLAVHIGSQIATIAPYRAAFMGLASLTQALRQQNLPVHRIDCGGGLAIAYKDERPASIEAYAGVIHASLGQLGVQLQIEPGRWLVGPAGVLLAQVLLVKAATPRPFLVLDAAMNDLARPALYESWHGIVPLAPTLLHAPRIAYDVVGPVCESTDILARARQLPPLRPNDLVAILDCGAYGAVMSAAYNARPLAAQALVDGPGWTTIRPRQPVQALWANDIVPP